MLMKLYKDNKERNLYFSAYFKYLGELLNALDKNAIGDVVDCFLAARANQKTIYFAGNGGSAATASHFAQDLAAVGRQAKAGGFRACSLTDNVSLITALGNDCGYDKVFSIQIQEMFREGDVLVAISASGNSPNVVHAVESAAALGGITVGLVGFDGGKLAKMCDYVIQVNTVKGEYGPVEDIHMVLDHLMTSYLMFRLSSGDPHAQ